jgi:hypothetical protein
MFNLNSNLQAKKWKEMVETLLPSTVNQNQMNNFEEVMKRQQLFISLEDENQDGLEGFFL